MWSYLHELLFGALGADYVRAVGDEALANQGGLALGADEAIVVPVAVLEWDEAGAADAWKETTIAISYNHSDSINLDPYVGHLKDTQI